MALVFGSDDSRKPDGLQLYEFGTDRLVGILITCIVDVGEGLGGTYTHQQQ